MIRGIIFDMDGVLVMGANKFHLEAWKKAFKEQNIHVEMMSLEAYGKLEGMKGDEIQDLILKQNNISLEPQVSEEIYKRKKEIFAQIDNPFTPEETKVLLRSLFKQGLKLALASGNNRTVIDNFLRKQNLQDIFHYTITGDEVSSGKPDPEVFIKALEKLQLPKNEVVIVENAPLGVQAAKATGIYTIALPSTVPAELLSSADKVIDNLQKLQEVIQTL